MITFSQRLIGADDQVMQNLKGAPSALVGRMLSPVGAIGLQRSFLAGVIA
jgi:hypothetical protein